MLLYSKDFQLDLNVDVVQARTSLERDFKEALFSQFRSEQIRYLDLKNDIYLI